MKPAVRNSDFIFRIQTRPFVPEKRRPDRKNIVQMQRFEIVDVHLRNGSTDSCLLISRISQPAFVPEFRLRLFKKQRITPVPCNPERVRVAETQSPLNYRRNRRRIVRQRFK